MGKIGKVYYIYLETDHGWNIQRGAGCYMRTRRVQDKAWVIDLHLVKHSGIGQNSGGVGWAKVEWWAACFHVFKGFSLSSALRQQMSSALASFDEEVGGFSGRMASSRLWCWRLRHNTVAECQHFVDMAGGFRNN
ncbi:hypothetical protein N7G274_009451 [Stereocaulon virgatum]|uniref:LAGLIDADG homing endonuclease n=1 Tax=Stereocaulon virgatum TaxID=373712 RepID=A0ABR3ZYC0_9LECA